MSSLYSPLSLCQFLWFFVHVAISIEWEKKEKEEKSMKKNVKTVYKIFEGGKQMVLIVGEG